MHQAQRESALDPIIHMPPGRPATYPDNGPGRATDWCPFDDHVRISPWLDPVVDRRGHDPRSTYVERFWLGTLGPTATWLLRRLASGLDEQPDGYELDLAPTAQSLGLSYTKGNSSPFAKAFGRCIMFGLAQIRSDGYAIRRRIPEVARRHLIRLPADLQTEHQRWVGAAATLDSLQRGRTLAAAMVDAGDDTEVFETQLVALGLSAPTAAQVIEMMRSESRCRDEAVPQRSGVVAG